MAISGSESQSAAAASSQMTIINNQVVVELVKCDCCGLTEECTDTYIAKVRERHQGRWICGLCAEAVKDEVYRSGRRLKHMISTEEALDRHMNFCNKFRSSSSPPPNPTEHLISAMRQLLRRSLDSPRAAVSNPTSPRAPIKDSEVRQLARSESCFSALAC